MYIELRCFMAYLLSFLIFIVAYWIRFVKAFEMPFYSYRRKKSRGVTENLKKIVIFWEMQNIFFKNPAIRKKLLQSEDFWCIIYKL